MDSHTFAETAQKYNIADKTIRNWYRTYQQQKNEVFEKLSSLIP